MILHAFYNLTGIGDILLVRLKSGQTDFYDKEDDLVTLKEELGNIIGYNVLNASKYFTNLNTGLVKINQQFIDELNQLLPADDKVDSDQIDLSPKFIVGKVLTMEDHPDSDHLHVCQVDLGTETTQIVCGAPNVEAGQTVVVATIGAIMPSGLIIKPSKLRKIDSNGMICSARELNLSNAPQKRGILVLDEKNYSIGDSFFE